MKNGRARLVGAVTAFCLLFGAVGSPASASDVDLGPATTMEGILASPEYRPWHADVLRLYRAFFNREPDVGGAAYWVDVYEDGAGLDDLAWGFSNSEEFAQTYGATLSNEEFLTVVYSNVLGRAPDPGGFTYWLDQMNMGLSQPGVVRWVVANEEFINAYPYEGTATPVQDYILPANLVSGLTGEYDVTIPDGPYPVALHEGCNKRRAWPKNFGFGIYAVNGNADLLEQAYEFSTVQAAEAFMDNFQTFTDECSSYGWQYSNGVVAQMTVTDISVPNLGDEAAGHYFRENYSGSGALHWEEIAVRIGRLVVLVDVTSRTPTPVTSSASYIVDAVNYAQTVQAG